MAYVIVGTGLVCAWLWKVSKGPAWKGWGSEIFGEDDDDV
jgi:hypothetical protein